MARFLKLQWKADNPNDNPNEYFRIDFNTPTITTNSRYQIFHAIYIPPPGSVGAAHDVPDDTWYNILPGPRGDIVRDNIRSLLAFVRNHSGTSIEYIQALNTIERSIGGAIGILIDSGIKRRKSKKISKKRSMNKKKRSSSKKRIKRKSKKRYCNK